MFSFQNAVRHKFMTFARISHVDRAELDFIPPRNNPPFSSLIRQLEREHKLSPLQR